MEIRIDKVLKMPGLIKGGYTCSLIFKEGVLFIIKTGIFVDFDKIQNYGGGIGLEKAIAGAVANTILDKLNKGRIEKINDFEKTINDQSLQTLAQGKQCFMITKNEIQESAFNESTHKLKLKTTRGKFNLYISTQSDRSKIPQLMKELTI